MENKDRAGRPSAESILKLAHALCIGPDELYAAAGLIGATAVTKTRQETPEEIQDRLRLAMPISVPIYPWEAFPFHAGDMVEPLDYIPIPRRNSYSKNIEAYICHGTCLEPKVNDGDVIIVDRDGKIENGDIVACRLDHDFHVLRVRKVAGEIFLENNYRQFKFEECQDPAPVIGIHKWLK